ncbi:MAG: outer membrane protein assembly factor BamA [Candidatus Pacebacteria bacterium]|nr:outer membrane protein assembly factor BamA [Candidatus Paceibacterota bacterium]
MKLFYRLQRLPLMAVLAVLCLVWLGLTARLPLVFAAETGSPLQISEIAVQGNQRIEVEAIYNYIDLKIGDQFSQERVDSSLKSLFRSQLFADAQMSFDRGVLTVKVKENPIVYRLYFEGNKKLDSARLRDEIQLRESTVYTKTKVQSDTTRLLEIYRRAGRYDARVEPKIVPRAQNRVDVVFEITEGAATGIGGIRFIGNNRFEADELRRIILTRETRWWRFLSTEDNYDPDRINIDREYLRRYYLKNGFADFRVVSATAELSPDRRYFYLTFTVEEGERYRVGKVNLTSQIKKIQPSELEGEIKTIEGDWYDNSLIDSSIAVMTNLLGNRGYAFATIEPKITKNSQYYTLDIDYTIKETPKSYIEKINILGNVRTLDSVIRREFRLAEGDAFNTTRVNRSEQRVRNLGFFSAAEVTSAPGSTPDRSILNTRVQEQGTGQVNFGAGYSSADGLLGQVSLGERNLLGRGYAVNISATVAQLRQNYDISFTDPYFMNRPLSATIQLFNTLTNSQAASQYSQETKGGSVGFGFSYSERLSQSVRYSYRLDDIRNVQPTASSFIQEQAGKTTTSLVGHDISFDYLDNSYEPSNGFYASYGNDVSGLGGDIHTVRTRFRSTVFYSPASQWIGSLHGEIGNIYGTGHQAVRIGDRYFLGGDNLRGFASGGAGPRDACTGDALGGNRYWSGTAELQLPIGVPEEFGMSGRVFSDFGAAYGVNYSSRAIIIPGCKGPEDIQSTTFTRVSYGTGMTWKSPFGPIRLDFAWPIRQEKFDRTEVFRISFGSRF